MPKTPRTPRRYDPVLPSDIPPGTLSEVARRMIGKTDPAVKRRSRPPEAPPSYGRRSSSPLPIAPPQRVAQTQQRTTTDKPAMPQRRTHDQPAPLAHRQRSGSPSVASPPQSRATRQHEQPAPPSPDRRSLAAPDLPTVGGPSSSSPRRTAGPDRPVMLGRSRIGSGMELSPPSPQRSSGGGMDLMPFAPPSFAESVDFDVPDMRGAEPRGIMGVHTVSSFLYGGN